MLTPRQNLLECIHGGNPDRYVKQFEAFSPLISGNPLFDFTPNEEGYLIDEWGCSMQAIEGQPGLFPVHDATHTVCTDITEWKTQVTPPADVDDPALWASAIEQAEQVDREQNFVSVVMIPGMFERTHHLCDISEAMVNMYEEPECCKELIACITDWEMRLAEAICKYIKPEVIFHHDDLGTQISTFMAPEMFEEFYLDAYKKVYGYYKNHGVELIVHHSDSYGETLVPYFIDMGVDIWQGVLSSTNDIPKLIEQYGDKISFMGAIESQIIDKPDWTAEEVRDEVTRAIDTVNNKTFFIPCMTGGMNDSGYPGVYAEVDKMIDEMSTRDFQ